MITSDVDFEQTSETAGTLKVMRLSLNARLFQITFMHLAFGLRSEFTPTRTTVADFAKIVQFQVTGYLRGKGLGADQLVHLPGLGHYR